MCRRQDDRYCSEAECRYCFRYCKKRPAISLTSGRRRRGLQILARSYSPLSRLAKLFVSGPLFSCAHLGIPSERELDLPLRLSDVVERIPVERIVVDYVPYALDGTLPGTKMDSSGGCRKRELRPNRCDKQRGRKSPNEVIEYGMASEGGCSRADHDGGRTRPNRANESLSVHEPF